MAFHYRVYGLAIACDRQIPSLEPSLPQGPPDIVIHLLDDGSLPDRGPIDVRYYASTLLNANGDPLMVVAHSPQREHFTFLFDDGTHFLIDRSASEVWARWLPPLTVEDLATYLLGPIFAFLLLLRGRVCLHASAIAVGDSAVAFVGPSGAGKSTLAAALVARGLRVVSEDVLPVRLEDGRAWVDPGGPFIRLWQSSVHRLFGAPDAMPLLTPNWDKRFQPLSAQSGNFMPHTCRLRAIYLLAPREPDQHRAVFSSMTARDALMALVTNTFANKLLDTNMRAHEFVLLGELLAKVPVRQLKYGDGFQFLPDVCSDVLRDIEQLDRTAPALA